MKVKYICTAGECLRTSAKVQIGFISA